VSKEDFEALKMNYGKDAVVESTPQMATHVNSSTDGTTVPSADRQVSIIPDQVDIVLLVWMWYLNLMTS
jgi:hypothetical protein